MKDTVRQQLNKFHATLDKEFKELAEIRNELIKTHQFEMANDIYRIEDSIHNLQSTICRNLDDLNEEKRKRNQSAPFKDNVD